MYNGHTKDEAMRKIFLTGFILLTFATRATAFLYEVNILSRDQIQKLTNEQLLDNFKAAVIERKADETFHGKAGFTPKEYANYKALLGFIIDIREEMAKRELEPPPIEDWLR